MSTEHYGATICLNGHVLTKEDDGENEGRRFCAQCGKALIGTCPKCNQQIRGWTLDTLDTSMDAPAYCPQCGEPYPWQQAKLDALSEAIDELEELTDDEKERLLESVPDLITDTLRTETAVLRVKKALTKVGAAGGKVLTSLLTSVVTDGVKKLLGLP